MTILKAKAQINLCDAGLKGISPVASMILYIVESVGEKWILRSHLYTRMPGYFDTHEYYMQIQGEKNTISGEER